MCGKKGRIKCPCKPLGKHVMRRKVTNGYEAADQWEWNAAVQMHHKPIRIKTRSPLLLWGCKCKAKASADTRDMQAQTCKHSQALLLYFPSPTLTMLMLPLSLC